MSKIATLCVCLMLLSWEDESIQVDDDKQLGKDVFLVELFFIFVVG